MIYVLVVEDNAEKRARIARSLSEVIGGDMNGVEFVGTVREAMTRVQTRLYDVLILDISLPMRAQDDASPHGGIEFLKSIISRPQVYKMPGHVIGVTAYEDIYAEVAGQFSSRLLTLVQYDAGSSDWEHALQARVRHIVDFENARAIEPNNIQCDVAIVCALHSPELSAVLNLPWNWQQIGIAHDHTPYWRGSFIHCGHHRSVYAANAARMGMPSAAVLATKMIYNFRPRHLAMVGIAAGVRGKVNIGDVVAADPCWDWGNGKIVTSAERDRLLASPVHLRLSPSVREHIHSISRDRALLANIMNQWPSDLPETSLAVHVGPMASGASVLADGGTISRIIEQQRNLLAVEMEAYSVFEAAEEAPEPHPTAFVLKSIVDFANGEKDDRFQKYGAYTSSKMLQHLCEDYLWA
jgi:nucleoside phosphorylase/CheY-like chemotaxis protein